MKFIIFKPDFAHEMETNLKTISDLKPGEFGIINEFREETESYLRLQELGLLPGVKIEVIRKAPLGGPMEIKIKNCHLSIRLKEAAHIIVEF